MSVKVFDRKTPAAFSDRFQKQGYYMLKLSHVGTQTKKSTSHQARKLHSGKSATGIHEVTICDT